MVKKKKKRKDTVVESGMGDTYAIKRTDKKGMVQGVHSVSDKSDRDNEIIMSSKKTEIPNPFNKKKPMVKIKKKKVYAQKAGTTDRGAVKGTSIELFGKKIYDKKKEQIGKKADNTKKKIEKEGLGLLKLKKKKKKGY